MNDQTIICTSCGKSIPLSETLTHQLRVNIQKEYETRFAHEKSAWLEKEKRKLWTVAQEKAKEQNIVEFKDRETQINEQKKKIELLEKKELDLRREKRLIEEERKKIELEVERRVDEIRKETINSLRKTQEDEYRIKMLEKDKQLDMMKKTIEELKRKSEQGSMQIQGEVQELDLKNNLTAHFPMDTIEDVPTAMKGADIIQTVMNNYGQKTGIILWESKNTKTFSVDWIAKLKDDQVRVKADLCILVTRTLPEGVSHFGLIDGVWVSEYTYSIQLTNVLRTQLVRIATIKQSLVGSGKKMEYLYNYLLSSEFKHKIENIVSSFTSLKSELESEKRAMQRIWSRREKEIERVITNTSSFYGDLQGVIGDSLPAISSLELSDGK